jgi:MFS family permease
MSVALLAIGVKEPASTKPSSFKQPIHWRMLSQLDVTYWRIVILGAVFTIARFSEAFLVLRARQYGLPDFLAPLVLVAMNIIYMFSAYPAGVLADRFDRRLLIAAGLIALISADLVLARSTGLVTVMIGIGFWGLHLGLTQGVFAAMIAACAPAHLRASAFGLFNLACGLAMLLASVLAGCLWDQPGDHENAEDYLARHIARASQLLGAEVRL